MTPRGGRSSRVPKRPASAADFPRSRQRILSETTALFSGKGVRATTIREIAEKAGVNTQLIYYYFRDKSGLADAVLGEAAGRVNRLLVTAARATGTPRQRLEAFILAWVRVTLDQAPAIRLLHGMVQEQGKTMVQPVQRRSSDNAARIRQLIREGVAAGEFRRDVDPRMAAASLVGMTHYLAIGGEILLSAMALEKVPRLSEKMAKHTASLFLRAIEA